MTEEPKRQKRSLAQIIAEKLRSKPATQTEINQLKLEVEKAKQVRDLRIIKSQTPSKFEKILSALTTLSSTPEQNKKRKMPKI